jgi:hypothetical protein
VTGNRLGENGRDVRFEVVAGFDGRARVIDSRQGGPLVRCHDGQQSVVRRTVVRRTVVRRTVVRRTVVAPYPP